MATKYLGEVSEFTGSYTLVQDIYSFLASNVDEFQKFSVTWKDIYWALFQG